MMESAADALGRDAVADLIVPAPLPAGGPAWPHGPAPADRRLGARAAQRAGDGIWTRSTDGSTTSPRSRRCIPGVRGSSTRSPAWTRRAATGSWSTTATRRSTRCSRCSRSGRCGACSLEPPLETLFREWLRTPVPAGGDRERARAGHVRPRRAFTPSRTTRRTRDHAVQAAVRARGAQTLPSPDAGDRLPPRRRALAGDERRAAAADELESDRLAGPEASAARARLRRAGARLESDGASADLDALLTERQEAERVYLREAKSLVASGVRVFELHEADAPTRGRDALLGALRGIAPLTRAHLARSDGSRS